jgi:hypothetical protein
MRSVLWTFNATRRRRWLSWLALALLVALVGGTVLAGVTAARRTSTAYPEFDARYGGDAALFSTGRIPAAVSRLPGLHIVYELSTVANGNVTVASTFIPANDFGLVVLPPSGATNAFRLLSGRLPTKPDEILAGFSLEQQAHLQLGSIIKVPLYALSQQQPYFNATGYLQPTGPVATFHVVGFSASVLDFPSNTPSYTVIASAAFGREMSSRAIESGLAIARFAGGASALPRVTYELNHLGGGGYVYPYSLVSQANAVESSIHPQVAAWWLFALIAAVAGLALVGQALSRQAIVERATHPPLAAVGFTPTQLFSLGMARAAAIGIVGTAGAVALAVGLSPFTPVGEARAAEPNVGVFLDGPVLALGAVAILLVVLALAVYPSWRASNARQIVASENEVGARRASIVAGAAARGGAPVPMVIGIRHALERGRGRGSVPVAAALVGTMAAVTALVASSVFGASLSNLLATPRLYGQAWNFDVGSLSGPTDTAIVAKLATNPAVTNLMYGISNKLINVNGVPANVTIIRTAKGHANFALVAGREPSAPSEIVLGTQTLEAAHAQVGETAKVAIIGPSGKTFVARLRVVGEIAIPPVLSQGGLGDGAAMTIPAALALLCGTDHSAACSSKFTQKIMNPTFTNWGMAVTIAPTAAGQALRRELDRSLSANVEVETVPVNLLNFGASINFPELLGFTLAIFGMATLIHLLLVSIARRRRELALLKVLGFVRRQIRVTVTWQAVTVGLVGVAVGVPVGIVAGHAAWLAFATYVGAVPESVVPAGQLAVIGAAVLLVGIALAVIPAGLASRVRPAVALREQ